MSNSYLSPDQVDNECNAMLELSLRITLVEHLAFGRKIYEIYILIIIKEGSAQGVTQYRRVFIDKNFARD